MLGTVLEAWDKEVAKTSTAPGVCRMCGLVGSQILNMSYSNAVKEGVLGTCDRN